MQKRFIMSETKTTKPLSRRRFVLISAVGGASLLTGLYLAASRRDRTSTSRELDERTVLFRNPAFRSGRTPKDPTVTTITAKGQQIAFRMDAEAKALWDAIPTAAGFHKGEETTVAQLLKLMVDKFREREASQVRREAFAFLQQALAAGVVLKPGARVFEKYEPKRSA